MKTIYYAKSSDKWSAMTVNDDFEVVYPFTNVEIPEELKGKEIKFDWRINEWYDYSLEANKNEVDQLKKVIATQTMTINNQAKTISELENQIKQSQQISAIQMKQLNELKAQIAGGK